MVRHTIDVCAVLRSAVNQTYGNLLTRPTGMAVRHQIERELAAVREGGITSLDFSSIGMMDYSCADEVVAKLLVLLENEDPTRGGFVVFRGIGEDHLELVESVLTNHGLALVCVCEDGSPQLIGAVSTAERMTRLVFGTRGMAMAMMTLISDGPSMVTMAIARTRPGIVNMISARRCSN